MDNGQPPMDPETQNELQQLAKIRPKNQQSWRYEIPELSDTEMESFCEILRVSFSVDLAAKKLGYHPVSLHRYKDSHPEFAKMWDLAQQIALNNLESEAYRRAVLGVEKPVWYKGVEVGYVLEYSDSLLSKLLEGNHPEKYKNQSKVNVNIDTKDPAEILAAAHQKAERRRKALIEGEATESADGTAQRLEVDTPGATVTVDYEEGEGAADTTGHEDVAPGHDDTAAGHNVTASGHGVRGSGLESAEREEKETK